MLIARVKEAQEREIPELAERLAAVEAFQAIGDEVRRLFRVLGNGVSCWRGGAFSSLILLSIWRGRLVVQQ